MFEIPNVDKAVLPDGIHSRLEQIIHRPRGNWVSTNGNINMVNIPKDVKDEARDIAIKLGFKTVIFTKAWNTPNNSTCYKAEYFTEKIYFVRDDPYSPPELTFVEDISGQSGQHPKY
jgi:hypothetical protein